MNKRQEHIPDEIIRAEKWLSDLMRKYPEPDCPVIDGLKLQVRFALADDKTPIDVAPPSPQTIRNIKQAVRAELAGRPSSKLTTLSRSWWFIHRRALGGLAAAAILAFSVTPILWEGRGTPTVKPVPVYDDIVAVLASAGQTTFSLQLEDLESEIDSLADSIILSDDSALVGEESYLEQLEDELDSLLTDDFASLEI